MRSILASQSGSVTHRARRDGLLPVEEYFSQCLIFKAKNACTLWNDPFLLMILQISPEFGVSVTYILYVLECLKKNFWWFELRLLDLASFLACISFSIVRNIHNQLSFRIVQVCMRNIFWTILIFPRLKSIGFSICIKIIGKYTQT